MRMSTRLSFVIAVLFLLFTASIEAQSAKCRPCEVALESCTVNCFGRENKEDMMVCLMGCGNAAAVCSCDTPATLSAEGYAARFGLDVPAGFKANTCHSTTSCGSAYGACTSWSTYTPCDDPTCNGLAIGCGACDEWGHCEITGPGMTRHQERYRVCLNDLGQSCTEYQRTRITVSCGC